jgi:hypothetical protein
MRTVYRVTSAAGTARTYHSALIALADFERAQGGAFDVLFEHDTLGDGEYRIDAGGDLGVLEIEGNRARVVMASTVWVEDIAQELAAVTGRRWTPRASGQARRVTFDAAKE